MYRCKDGTNNKISETLKKGSKAPGMDHERGVAYLEFNNLIEEISSTHKPTFVDGIYETY